MFKALDTYCKFALQVSRTSYMPPAMFAFIFLLSNSVLVYS